MRFTEFRFLVCRWTDTSHRGSRHSLRGFDARYRRKTGFLERLTKVGSDKIGDSEQNVRTRAKLTALAAFAKEVAK
jgi:hypothetical protein